MQSCTRMAGSSHILRETEYEGNTVSLICVLTSELVLAAISRYHQGNADATWKAALRRSTLGFDGKGLIEEVGSSVIMAAGLVSAGQTHDAPQILDRMLPSAQIMLLSQHPQVCMWLIEVSMDSSTTVAGSVRRTVKS